MSVTYLSYLLIRSVYREIRQREQIQLQEKALEIANEQQENFIHFLSHEVKGILGKNKAMFALLLEGDGQAGQTSGSTSSAASSASAPSAPARPMPLAPDLKPLVLQSLNDTNQSVDIGCLIFSVRPI